MIFQKEIIAREAKQNVLTMEKILTCVFIGILVYVWDLQLHLSVFKSVNKICWEDFIENTTHCIPLCPNGSFALPGMKTCHPLLSCADNISIKQMIDFGVVKKVYLAEWEGHPVAVSRLSSPLYEDDFNENLKFLSSLGRNNFTVQFVGYCNNSIMTQYYKLGSALTLNHNLHNHLSQFNTLRTRFKLCINYAEILKFLHSSPVGVRVMCDSNTLEKTLSQYLLSDDLELVINDLDAVPSVDVIGKKGIICGKKQLFGTFVAPEQLWPFESEFSFDQMPTYGEKSDIWKIPDVCDWFLGNSTNSDIMKFKLFILHKRCKSKDPSDRPNAASIVDVYQTVYNEFFTDV